MFYIRNKLKERSKERSTEIEVFHTKRTVGDVLKHANTAVTESSPKKTLSESTKEPKNASQKTENQPEKKKSTTRELEIPAKSPVSSTSSHPPSTRADKANPVKPLATAF